MKFLSLRLANMRDVQQHVMKMRDIPVRLEDWREIQGLPQRTSESKKVPFYIEVLLKFSQNKAALTNVVFSGSTLVSRSSAIMALYHHLVRTIQYIEG